MRQSSIRDRHGRGVRGPLWLPGPLTPRATERLPSRRAAFDEIVLALVERLTTRLDEELSNVEFGTEDVPRVSDGWREAVPMGSVMAPDAGGPARVVLFRRPIEEKATSRSDRIALAQRQLVELVAELLGRSPEDLDDVAGPDGLNG